MGGSHSIAACETYFLEDRITASMLAAFSCHCCFVYPMRYMEMMGQV